MIDPRYSLQTTESTLDATEDLLNRLVPADSSSEPTATVAQVKGAALLIGQAVKLHGLLKKARPSDQPAAKAADHALSSGPYALIQGGAE